MDIPFEVDGAPAEFRFSLMTGAAILVIAGQEVHLQSALDLKSHYGKSLSRTWRHQADGHVIEITKVRPQFLAGFRANEFNVVVDGQLVAAAKGR